MTTVDTANRIGASAIAGRPAATTRFDLLATLTAGWFVLGLFVDGWAHSNGKVDNTFFTPWHALMYSGVLAVGLLMSFAQTRNMQKGYAWTKSLPLGYGWSLIGVGIFFVAGGFDLMWHNWFGFEGGFEALISPSHLALATGAFLFLTGPVRAALYRKETEHGWVRLFPLVLNGMFLMSLLSFFMMSGNPFSNLSGLVKAGNPGGYVEELWQIIGVTAFMIQAAISTGLVLLIIRRWTLPFGAFTLMIGGNATLMFVIQLGAQGRYANLLVAVFAAGFVLDVIASVLKPSAERHGQFRAFAFLMPAITFGALFALLIPAYGTWWSVHVWAGTVFMSGIVGLLLSYLAVTPVRPENA